MVFPLLPLLTRAKLYLFLHFSTKEEEEKAHSRMTLAFGKTHNHNFRIFSGQSWNTTTTTTTTTTVESLSKKEVEEEEEEDENDDNKKDYNFCNYFFSRKPLLTSATAEKHRFNKLKILEAETETTTTKVLSFSSDHHHHHPWSSFKNKVHLKEIHLKEKTNTTMKLHLKVLHWVNIYQNTENIRHYCGDLENLPRRSSAACRRSRAIFAVLALKTAHFYYLFTARGLTELQRLLHFDFTVLIRATPNLNCLSFAMLLLNLVAFYLLFWFDFQKTPTDVKGLANRGKRLAPAYLVSQVYCQQNSKRFLFRREESDQNQNHQQQQNRKSKKGASVISVIEKWMRQVSFLIDIYVSAIISKFLKVQ